jgi:hypothetical protein
MRGKRWTYHRGERSIISCRRGGLLLWRRLHRGGAGDWEENGMLMARARFIAVPAGAWKPAYGQGAYALALRQDTVKRAGG